MKTLKFILQNLDEFKTRFILVFVVALGAGTVFFMIPVTLSELTKGDFNYERFQKALTFVILLYLSSLTLQWIIRRYGESLSQQFSNHIRFKYFKALERLPTKEIVNHHSGYILSLINKIGDGITPLIHNIFWSVAHSIANFTLFFFFTARESVFLALLNAGVLIVFLVISTILSIKMVELNSVLNLKRAKLMETYADFMANILTIKKLGVYSFVEEKLNARTKENYEQIRTNANFHSKRWSMLHSLFGVAYMSTIGYILLQVSRGELSVSVLILFVTAYTLIRINLGRLSENFKEMMEMSAYIETLDDIVSPKTKFKSADHINTWHEIKFQDIDFEYKGTNKKIHVPAFSLSRGQKISIVGRSGEGKTTFLNLLANNLEPYTGERLLDGKSYQSFDKDIFQYLMVTISQEVELFNISLRENITLGQAINDSEIEQALTELDLWSWVNTLKDGPSTIVGEKGVKLSAGQRQRINLLRGILLNREIYLLDEPTSHLDVTTEQKVVDFLAKRLQNKTAVIVSHREAVTKICDRRYQIKNHILASRD